MLAELAVENLGVIDRLQLVLGPGHDRAHRRDRSGQDPAGRSASTSWSVAGPIRRWCGAGAATRRSSRDASCSATTRSCCVGSSRPTGGQPGLRRRPPGDGHRPQRGRASAWSTCTVSTPTSRCCRARPSGPPSTASATSTCPGWRRAGPRWPSSKPPWPTSAATTGLGPASWTCSASRWPRSIPPPSAARRGQRAGGRGRPTRRTP